MISVDGLTFHYPGQAQATLDDVRFEVPRGEVFGLLGPSGAGKSTTQRLLLGLERAPTGCIRLFGRPIEAWDRRLYRRIGVSFELPAYHGKLTGRENLAVFADLYGCDRARVMTVLDQVALADAADTRCEHYSKGMKMRLNLARALLPEPELLFLDEPTAGLDPVTAERVKTLIDDQRARGCTVFLTTHNMTDADALCDRVAFLVDGRIRCIDRPEALKHAHGEASVVVTYGDDTATRQARFDLATLADNADFHRLLRAGRVRGLHSQEASLADVFAVVTGATLS